ncbi:hypothetical protein A142_18220 [Vibrio splendidus 12E03]|uniref:Uncharacterized protein n=1 Tax=Vibrio splendidus 12E03 TaxID=1191305 RepID=A0A1E5FUE0_VIBSP|nr:hypothetical protein A142_18220 [Vibrio splendidus 12E03]
MFRDYGFLIALHWIFSKTKQQALLTKVSFLFLMPIVLSNFLNVLIVLVRDSSTIPTFIKNLIIYSHIDHYGYKDRVKNEMVFALI